MKVFLIVFAALIVTVACIEPIVFDTNGEKGPVAIYGVVSNEIGSSYITVGQSVPYDNESFNTVAILPLPEAVVNVVDKEGKIYGFSSREIGKYDPVDPNFKGEIGMEYKIVVTLSDGKTYESGWDLMVPVPPIERLELRPFQRSILSNGIEVLRRGVEVRSVFNDPPEVRNYYKWRWLGVYEIQYSFDEDGPCWVREQDLDDLIIFTDDELNGQQIEKTILQVGYNGRVNIQNKYMISVEQQSMTEEAYEYHRQVMEQRESQGTLFDPTPAQIKGNIYSLDDENEVVVGYFGASASAVSRFTIDTILENAEAYINCEDYINQRRIPVFCFDCTAVANASRNKPIWY